MPKMIVSIDGVVIKEVQLTKERTTLGRRPYNDIVIDNLAVSGEHAVLQMVGSDVFIEDLNSTNGTYINGKAIKRQRLHDGDVIAIGNFRIQYSVASQAAAPMNVTTAFQALPEATPAARARFSAPARSAVPPSRSASMP